MAYPYFSLLLILSARVSKHFLPITRSGFPIYPPTPAPSWEVNNYTDNIATFPLINTDSVSLSTIPFALSIPLSLFVLSSPVSHFSFIPCFSFSSSIFYIFSLPLFSFSPSISFSPCFSSFSPSLSSPVS